MYVWFWNKLPGGTPGKLAGSVVALAAVLALLFFLVFPWAEPRLPFNNVNVDQPSGGGVQQPAGQDAPDLTPSAPVTTVSPTSTVVIHPSSSPRA
jgi:hypothetical protein